MSVRSDLGEATVGITKLAFYLAMFAAAPLAFMLLNGPVKRAYNDMPKGSETWSFAQAQHYIFFGAGQGAERQQNNDISQAK